MSCPAQYPDPCEYRQRALERFWWALVDVIELPVVVAEMVCECSMLGFFETHGVCAELGDEDEDEKFHDEDEDRSQYHRSSEGEQGNVRSLMSDGISKVSKMSSTRARPSTPYSWSSSDY